MLPGNQTKEGGTQRTHVRGRTSSAAWLSVSALSKGLRDDGLPRFELM
jgi:hypothetical protein